MFDVFNQTKQSRVGRVRLANHLLDRMIGLLKHSHLDPNEGLWIQPCSSIHTFFMRFPIDVIFLSKDHRVLKTYENLSPFKLTRWIPQSASVIELSSGSLRQTQTALGDHLRIEEIS